MARCSFGFHRLNVTRILFLILATGCSLAGGCAIGIGIGGKERIVCGFMWVRRLQSPGALVVDQRSIGGILRAKTSDDGLALGYSALTTVSPSDVSNPPNRSEGFRWPLGVAWKDGRGVLHEAGWIVTRVPEPTKESLLHRGNVGVGLFLSRRTIGCFGGVADKVFVEIPADGDQVYVVEYDSKRPFDSSFFRHEGRPLNAMETK